MSFNFWEEIWHDWLSVFMMYLHTHLWLEILFWKYWSVWHPISSLLLSKFSVCRWCVSSRWSNSWACRCQASWVTQLVHVNNYYYTPPSSGPSAVHSSTEHLFPVPASHANPCVFASPLHIAMSSLTCACSSLCSPCKESCLHPSAHRQYLPWRILLFGVPNPHIPFCTSVSPDYSHVLPQVCSLHVPVASVLPLCVEPLWLQPVSTHMSSFSVTAAHGTLEYLHPLFM